MCCCQSFIQLWSFISCQALPVTSLLYETRNWPDQINNRSEPVISVTRLLSANQGPEFLSSVGSCMGQIFPCHLRSRDMLNSNDITADRCFWKRIQLFLDFIKCFFFANLLFSYLSAFVCLSIPLYPMFSLSFSTSASSLGWLKIVHL